MKINFPFNLQLRLYLSCLEKRQGACSKVYKEVDKHITMWDFDNVELSVIKESLEVVQKQYKLPTIYIISSSRNRYHAYSFTARPFQEIVHILSGTSSLDVKYLRLGMVRGYYTLRISSRENDDFKLITTLESEVLPEVNPLDITVSEYMTINKGDNNA